MDVKFTLRQQDAAELILAGLQSELESFLDRPIEVQEFEEEYVIESMFTGIPMGTFISAGSNYYNDSFQNSSPIDSTTYAEPPNTIYLRNSPVASVSEVRVKPLNGNERILIEERDYIVRRFGIEYHYGRDGDKVIVTYEAGLNGSQIPLFKLLILRAASREMQNMHDDVVGLKDLNTRNVGPLITGFLDTELASVRKYRRTRVA
jgi:hypothetical protein